MEAEGVILHHHYMYYTDEEGGKLCMLCMEVMGAGRSTPLDHNYGSRTEHPIRTYGGNRTGNRLRIPPTQGRRDLGSASRAMMFCRTVAVVAPQVTRTPTGPGMVGQGGVVENCVK